MTAKGAFSLNLADAFDQPGERRIALRLGVDRRHGLLERLPGKFGDDSVAGGERAQARLLLEFRPTAGA